MVLSEKTLYSLGRRCVYIFNRRKAKKEIPVKVIDRTHLKAILHEHKLASTGLIDPQTARQLGRIAVTRPIFCTNRSESSHRSLGL